MEAGHRAALFTFSVMFDLDLTLNIKVSRREKEGKSLKRVPLRPRGVVLLLHPDCAQRRAVVGVFVATHARLILPVQSAPAGGFVPVEWSCAYSTS